MDYPFHSDGCSNPVQWIRDSLADLDIVQFCYIHDWFYWQGGTREQRKWADRILFRCIEQNSRYGKVAAYTYFAGVRIGGWLPLSSRWSWGYGWFLDKRGVNTRILAGETTYTADSQRWKLEALLATA